MNITEFLRAYIEGVKQANKGESGKTSYSVEQLAEQLGVDAERARGWVRKTKPTRPTGYEDVTKICSFFGLESIESISEEELQGNISKVAGRATQSKTGAAPKEMVEFRDYFYTQMEMMKQSMLTHEESIQVRAVSDMTARFIEDGFMVDPQNQRAHIDLLMNYTTHYLHWKKERAKQPSGIK